MALTVPHVGGDNTLSAAGGTSVSDAWTSVAGSLIVAIPVFYTETNTPANGDVTDSKGNSYTIVTGTTSFGSGVMGFGVWINNGGTRGASHTVTYDSVDAAAQNQLAVIEIEGHDASPVDATTTAQATDATSPFNVTSAAAISGSQIAIYTCVLDIPSNDAWTQPGGYSNIINQPDATAHIAHISSYKIDETGTPTVGASRAGTATAGKQLFFTIKAAGAAAQLVRPDADVTTTGWTTTPLFSKINDESDATVITATAS